MAVAAAVAAAVALLLLAVYSLRTYPEWGRNSDYMCVQVNRPFFREEPGPAGRTVRPNRGDVLGGDFSFAMPKPVGVKRVMLAGESAAVLLAGAPYENVLRKGLGPGTEVINLGMGAYDSSRILPVVRECLAYSPDLLLVFSGNNEKGPWIEACPGLSSHIKTFIRFARAALLLPGRGWAAALAEESYRTHRARLAEIAALARARGVPIIFAALPSDIKDMPPEGRARDMDPEFSAARDALAEKRSSAALAGFDAVLAKNPGDPFGHYYRGRALDALDRKTEAAAAYVAAAEQDRLGGRSVPSRAALVRSVAGPCLLDLEKAFNDAAGGLSGGNMLVDGLHWYPAYNPFVGAETLKAISACPAAAGLGPVKRVSVRSPSEFKPGREEASLLLNYASAWLFSPAPSVSGRLNHRVLAMLLKADKADRGFLLSMLRSRESLGGELRNNRWVDGMKPGMDAFIPVLLAHAAEVYRSSGEPALAAEFRRSAEEKRGGGR